MRALPPELAALYAKRPPRLIKPGLERIQAALSSYPNAKHRVPRVLVAGTNGKGTTAGYIWQLFGALGAHAGLFTSPHLREFRERIQTTKDNIGEAELLGLLDGIRQHLAVDVWTPMSFFEINTLLAFLAFEAHQTELDILEVGLGGAWDSTNVCDPKASVIASLGIDHIEFLGTSLAGIAREKAGVMRAGCPTFVGGPQSIPAAGMRVLEEEAQRLGADIFCLDRDFTLKEGAVHLTLPGLPAASFALPGRIAARPWFIRENFTLALALVYWFLHQRDMVFSWFTNREEAVLPILGLALQRFESATGLRTPPSLKARFETLSAPLPQGGETTFLFDVCHNVAGARALARAITEMRPGSFSSAHLPALVSIMGDKDVNGILDELRQALDPIVLFASGDERGFRHDQLAERHRDLYFAADFTKAIASLATPVRPLVVCGSVAVVGDVFEQLDLPVLD